MKNIGVLISGGGSNLQSIMAYIDKGEIPARIGLVLSSNKEAYGLARAKQKGIPSAIVQRNRFDDEESFGREILKYLRMYDIGYVVLAGYLNILPKSIIENYRNRIINVHPSLIPAFCGKGFYGMKVHRAVIDMGVKVTGATVHFVDEGTDTGPIILQEPLMVSPDDDAKTLSKKVLAIEHSILPKALKLLVEDRLIVKGRRVLIKV